MADRPRVLLVDDESAITDNLAPFLERSGFDVAVAADGEEALHQVASFAPDLIVSGRPDAPAGRARDAAPPAPGRTTGRR